MILLNESAPHNVQNKNAFDLWQIDALAVHFQLDASMQVAALGRHELLDTDKTVHDLVVIAIGELLRVSITL